MCSPIQTTSLQDKPVTSSSTNQLPLQHDDEEKKETNHEDIFASLSEEEEPPHDSEMK